MKLLLANEIYFKGLAVKVLTALKNHKEESVRVKSVNGGDIQYLLQCDISQFDYPLMSTNNKMYGATALHHHAPTSTTSNF